MKKILLVRTMPYDFDPTSYNVQEIGLGKAFCRLGYDYDYVTVKKKNQKEWVFYEYEGHTARWIEIPRIRIFRMGINLSILKKDYLKQYDHIICREYYQVMTFLLSQRASNVSMYSGPYWNMFFFSFVSPIYDFFVTRKMDKSLKGKFVKSDLALEYLEKKGYTNLKTVGVALDTQRFDECNSVASETQKVVEYMSKNKCLLYVGSVDANKNYIFLLKVYEKLLNKYPDLKFVVIGKSKVSAVEKLLGKKDCYYEEQCYEKVSSKTRAGIYRVERIENAQLKYIYPLAQAFLLPSKKEIFGMVLLEAMYLGAPVVTSRNGGSVTLIEGKETGLVVDKFDEDRWSAAVQRYLEDDIFRGRTVKNAMQLVREEYNWDSIAKKMIMEIENK